jgi:mannose-6-phosphate isomerase
VSYPRPVYVAQMNLTNPYHLEDIGPLRIEGCIQRYAWGKVGSASRIAPFLREQTLDAPLAEYWLGCHPKGQALALLPDGSRCPVADLLRAEDPLPFMLKVLSINPDFGLSIQSHPDSELARQLHARDPEHYPDPFHKPEVGIALTPVKLLYNIKTPEALREVLERYPEIVNLLSQQTRRGLASVVRELSTLTRREIFSDCITAKPEAVTRVVRAICERCPPSEEGTRPEEVVIMRRLAHTHGPGDAGLVVLLLMNLVSLAPGEAIFIGPNTPHAYLDGDLVECMACSDNVIRAGLTTKFRDVQTLIETTAFDKVQVPVRASVRENLAGYQEFLLPAREFRIGVVRAGADRVPVDLAGEHAVALCLGESAVVSYGVHNQAMTLSDGDAVLLPRGLIGYKVSTKAAQLFIARSGQIY